MVARPRRWKLALALTGIFLAGGVTGVFVAAGVVHHRLRALHSGGPHALHALVMGWFGWELDLDPDQEVAIEGILDETHHELFLFKSRHNAELQGIVLPALERIDAQLKPAQAETWAPIRARILEHAEAQAHSGG
jgi:hypothetical protein